MSLASMFDITYHLQSFMNQSLLIFLSLIITVYKQCSFLLTSPQCIGKLQLSTSQVHLAIVNFSTFWHCVYFFPPSISGHKVQSIWRQFTVRFIFFIWQTCYFFMFKHFFLHTHMIYGCYRNIVASISLD